MSLTFRIDGELSRAGLEAARNELDTLLGEWSEQTEPATPAEHSPDDDLRLMAEQKARRLHSGLDRSTTWRLLHAGAENYKAGQEFTLRELANVLDAEVGTVRAWHRLASKVVNRVNDEVGDVDEPQVMPVMSGYWDGRQNRYSMKHEMRQAILALVR